MLVYVFGKKFEADLAPAVQQFLEKMVRRGISICVYKGFERFLQSHIQIPAHTIFEENSEFENATALFSFGGDGTFLDAARLVGSKRIPLLGINTGRLGFLSHVSVSEVDEALEQFVNSEYTIDPRSFIQIKSEQFDFGDFPYALNEITINNATRNEMIKINASVNKAFLSSYWADGLIVATPTGSTGYSLSCNGPVVFPDSASFVITPVSPHNLNIRPIIVPDNSIISFEVEGRTDGFICTLDSRRELVAKEIQLAVKKETFALNLIRLNENNFLQTLRTKLSWGLDIRN